MALARASGARALLAACVWVLAAAAGALAGGAAASPVEAGAPVEVDLSTASSLYFQVTWKPVAVPGMVARICQLLRAPAGAAASPEKWGSPAPLGSIAAPTPAVLDAACGKPFQVDGSKGRVRIHFTPAATSPGIYEMYATNVPGGIEYIKGPRIVIAATTGALGEELPAAAAPATDLVLGQAGREGPAALDPTFAAGSEARPVVVEAPAGAGTSIAIFAAGGVAGGAVIAALAVAAFCLWRRRRARRDCGLQVTVATDPEGREVITIRRPDGNTLRGTLPAGALGPGALAEAEGKSASPACSAAGGSGGEAPPSPSLSASSPAASASGSACGAPQPLAPGDAPRPAPAGAALRIAASLAATQRRDCPELFARAVCTKCLRVNPGCGSEDEAAEAACVYCRLPLAVSRRFFPAARVGGGEFGTAFRAVDLHFLSKRPCILKKFTFLDRSSNESHVEKAARLFLDEGRTLELLDHPRIPKLLGSFVWMQDMYHAMAEVKGQDLQRALRARVHPYPRSEVLRLLDDLLGALAYVHERGVIHRDVKPSNLIAGEDGRYYLVDFGLSTTRRPDLDQATEIGTYAYADPEQRAGRPTPSSDLYSLAATCVEMMTKRRPALEFFVDWTPARSPEADFGGDLGAALARMLRRDVADRYPSAAAARAALFPPPAPAPPFKSPAPSVASSFSDAASSLAPAGAYQLGLAAPAPARTVDPRDVRLEEAGPPGVRLSAPLLAPPEAEEEELEARAPSDAASSSSPPARPAERSAGGGGGSSSSSSSSSTARSHSSSSIANRSGASSRS
eukprot:tig00020902_g14986.t1